VSVSITMEVSERIVLYSIAVNVSLVICKYGLAVFSGSLALRADAIHSCADIVSAASIWAGIRISRRKTRLFPYGLYKVENLMALVTVGLLALAGYEIVQSVLAESGRLRPTRLPVAMAGVVLIIVITLAFSRFELRKGRKLGFPSLEADARHINTDMFSAAIILVGLIGEYFRIKFPLDKVAALVIVVLIARVGVKIALDAIRVLLDASVDFGTLNDIRELILENPEVVKIKLLSVNNSDFSPADYGCC
jgi:cation diffusion facilitator family transporter